MPEIKNYDGKKKSPNRENSHGKHHNKHAKRRPHDEMTDAMNEAEEIMADAAEINEQAADEMEAINTEAQNEGIHPSTYDDESLAASEMIAEGAPAAEPNAEKVHLEFYGSEVIRQKAPKVMELADTVADEWVKDGQFEGLPVGNPLAQIAAAKVLRKAKDVEKKLEERGVFAMAKMGADYVKAEINKRKKH
ncbi:hypothetical protein [Bdellovibrio svalbardensis]|uniref:Uncharacterized protein n=1 Tax=Bdellovibrio svalbardensis TaxID=2972972 RepID=A0ABT6DLI5_9BACT|nr:hypothetical protein [Bdellovibrio svalbardensis]MDG0817737.1 hypothetical protein [Bdellovibrio svalbardensis]